MINRVEGGRAGQRGEHKGHVITTAMKGRRKESRKEPLESVIQNLLLQNLPKIHTHIHIQKRI